MNNGLTADTSAHVNANFLQELGRRADKIALVDRQIDFSAETFTVPEIKLSEGATIGNLVSGVLAISCSLKIGAYTLPATDGTANQILKTNGSGVVAWAADSLSPAAYTLPSVDGTAGQVLATNGSGVVSWVAKGLMGSYTLPTADGTNGQVLKTNGSGVVSWAADATE